jgi:hypothetical protein
MLLRVGFLEFGKQKLLEPHTCMHACIDLAGFFSLDLCLRETNFAFLIYLGLHAC